MKKKITKLVCSLLAAGMVSAGIPNFYSLPTVVHTVQAATSEVNITSSAGSLETAFVEWTPSSTSGVTGYTVSYASNGSSNYNVIDDELIRQYKDGHWRADVVGLAPGNYTLKVEAKGKSVTETVNVTVKAHDRKGFAFSPNSKFKTEAVGAYNNDGTPKSGAQIIYIKSASDIDTVTCDGVTGLSSILQSRNKRSSTPLIVRIIGKIDYSGSQLNGSGYIQIKPSSAYTKSDITIEGIGSDTTINFGFLLRNAGNVEIRNLAIHDFKDDGISLDTDNTDIWIHNNEIFYGIEGSGDKAKGDGSTDVKNDSQYVTISYNHYWDGGKVSLCGMKGESGNNYISYHHNHFDHSDSRHPRIRTMSVHVFNNYYDGNAKYGVGASENSSAFVEGNYFRNCKYPTLQGSVGKDSDGSGGSNTLEDSNPVGAIKWYDNTRIDTIQSADTTSWKLDSNGNTAGNGDACEAASRNQSITYTTEAGATYNNFDQDSYVQSLSIETPDNAKNTVEQYAGRIRNANGKADFADATGFAFTSGDDTAYSINSTLREALYNYCDNTLNAKYIINKIGGAVDDSFVPETSATTEATTTQEESTEATTSHQEESTEATTAAVEGEISIKYNNGYTFTGNGKLTSTISSDSAYYSILGNQIAQGNNYVQISPNKATVVDTDGTNSSSDKRGATTELYLPLGKTYTSGTLTIEGTFTTPTSSNGWTLLQLWGAGLEVASIRTDNNKYKLRLDGDNNTLSDTGATTGTTEATYRFDINLDAKTVKLTVNNNSSKEVTLNRPYIDNIKFITASYNQRNIEVGNVTVTTSNTGAVQGDINADGYVNSVDLHLALSYLTGGYSLTNEQISRGDFNGDGKLTLVDAYKLKTSIA